MTNKVQFFSPEKEYEKYDELKKESVILLEEWLKKQPHLPKLTELEIILFLHSCYFRNELAKITIDNFFTTRSLCPEFFAERDPRSAKFQIIFNAVITELDKRTSKDERVIYIKVLNSDPETFILSQYFKAFDMIVMLTLRACGSASGLTIIIDMDGVVFGHIAKLGLFTLKKIFYYLQEAMPVRISGIHFINSPSFIDKVLTLIKPFMKKELLDVLYVHTFDLSTLYPHVPKECLPKHLGGNTQCIEDLFAKEKKLFLDNVDYYLAEEKKTTDESKRVGKPKGVNEVFGVEGTFKKLDID